MKSLSLISGAVLGAAAIYFLDPDNGERRRRQVRDSAQCAMRGAENAIHEATDTVSEWWHDARDKAAELAHLGADMAAQAGNAVADTAASQYSNLRDTAAKMPQRTASQARDLTDRARQSMSESTHAWRHRLAAAIDPEHVRGPGHAAAWTSAGFGMLALGAAGMYFFDPATGERRREMVGNQIGRCVQETGHFFQHVGNYVARLWHRSPMPRSQGGPYPTDPSVGEQLVRRARAHIGRLLTNPMAIQLMADANGELTVFGSLPASQADALLAALPEVQGVRRVINRLEIETVHPEVSNPPPAVSL